MLRSCYGAAAHLPRVHGTHPRVDSARVQFVLLVITAYTTPLAQVPYLAFAFHYCTLQFREGQEGN
jgi:hypothetical protein